MNNHQASAPMLGYLYQVRCALDLLLSADNEQSSICIEKFDDIAFSKDGDSSNILIQTKHHINSCGNLTNSSVDLWRTLNVWIDLLKQKDISNIKFIIITTANAPEKSAASFMNDKNRNTSHVYEILKMVATESDNKSNKNFYDSFLEISPELMQVLLNNISVIDSNPNISNIVNDIKQLIRYSTRPEYLEKVFERVEGWWLKKSIEALCSTKPKFISQREVHTFISDVSSEYTSDNLPIDTEFIDDIDIEGIPVKERIFCEQLKLIDIQKQRIKLSIKDYYKAFTQRNNWVKDELIYVNELEKYEENLINEWQHLFTRIPDEIDVSEEKEKQKAGRTLLSNIEDKDIRIRPKCSDKFVMRGSYHMLANKLKVGWHFDFKERLEQLLNLKES